MSFSESRFSCSCGKSPLHSRSDGSDVTSETKPAGGSESFLKTHSALPCFEVRLRDGFLNDKARAFAQYSRDALFVMEEGSPSAIFA